MVHKKSSGGRAVETSVGSNRCVAGATTIVEEPCDAQGAFGLRTAGGRRNELPPQQPRVRRGEAVATTVDNINEFYVFETASSRTWCQVVEEGHHNTAHRHQL
eukprot:9343887-Heterocapsa_arctica.AAC.1